jgi:hypothetical protein
MGGECQVHMVHMVQITVIRETHRGFGIIKGAATPLGLWICAFSNRRAWL